MTPATQWVQHKHGAFTKPRQAAAAAACNPSAVPRTLCIHQILYVQLGIDNGIDVVAVEIMTGHVYKIAMQYGTGKGNQLVHPSRATPPAAAAAAAAAAAE